MKIKILDIPLTIETAMQKYKAKTLIFHQDGMIYFHSKNSMQYFNILWKEIDSMVVNLKPASYFTEDTFKIYIRITMNNEHLYVMEDFVHDKLLEIITYFRNNQEKYDFFSDPYDMIDCHYNSPGVRQDFLRMRYKERKEEVSIEREAIMPIIHYTADSIYNVIYAAAPKVPVYYD